MAEETTADALFRPSASANTDYGSVGSPTLSAGMRFDRFAPRIEPVGPKMGEARFGSPRPGLSL